MRKRKKQIRKVTIVRWALRLKRFEEFRLATRIHPAGPLRPRAEDEARRRRGQKALDRQGRGRTVNSIIIPEDLVPAILGLLSPNSPG